MPPNERLQETSTSYFGEAATQLARTLDIDGLVRLSLEKLITPVVVLEDCTLPGFRDRKGRRFAAGPQATNVGRCGLLVHPTAASELDGVIVEFVHVSTRVAASRVWGRVLSEAQVTPIWGVPATRNVNSSDNKQSASGEFPLQLAVIAVGGVAAPADLQWSINLNGVAAPFSQVIPVNAFLRPGQGIEFAAVAATTEIDVNFWGRVIA